MFSYMSVCGLCVVDVDWTTERQALLFIGHALVGYHGATCRLHGSCSVTDTYLNNTKLQRLSDVRLFKEFCAYKYLLRTSVMMMMMIPYEYVLAYKSIRI